MPFTGLVTTVAHQDFLVCEATQQPLGIGKFASAVASDVEYHAVTKPKESEHVAQVAVADAIGETLIDNVGDVIGQNGIFEAAADVVVCAKIPLAKSFELLEMSAETQNELEEYIASLKKPRKKAEDTNQ